MANLAKSLETDMEVFNSSVNRPTLRDQFAMAALQGILADQSGFGFNTTTEWARSAYQIADSMLEAREQ